MAYSHSRLGTYETCPRRYKFAYIDGLRREEEGIEAFLGSRFHEAMEKLYSELRFRVMSLEELLAFYEDSWKKNFHEKIVIINEERTADDYFRLGQKFIEDYYRHYYPFNQNRILGIEQEIKADLDGTGKYILWGFIDRIDLTPDGVYEIHDYKTGSTLPSQQEVDSDRQLALYQIGLQQRWPQAKKVRLVWHYVAFDQEFSSTRTPEQLEGLRREIIELIDQIEADREFPPKESALCGWCAFQALCPLKKHEIELAPLPANEYLQEEGVRLVNLYAEYTDRKKEIEAELEKLKDAIIKYAQDRGLERVMGSNFQVTLRKQERIQLPASGDEQRKRLEILLKQAGLWEQYSSLDRFALERAIKNKKIEDHLLQELSKLVSFETSIALYLAKKSKAEE
ncbi:MAG: PD-(D/E)XK nuclease family protein [Candidatus Aminicenantes bacterium]|nr:PD-(D/E)XK nuclease family protein [Candidatus Aminicenantes bacterium]